MAAGPGLITPVRVHLPISPAGLTMETGAARHLVCTAPFLVYGYSIESRDAGKAKEFIVMAKVSLVVAAIAVMFGIVFWSDGAADPSPATLSVIPAPRDVKVTEGFYAVTGGVMGPISQPNGLESSVEALFRETVFAYTGMRFPSDGPASIRFMKDQEVEGDEAYSIDISGDGVLVRAETEAGLFYGSMTLAQMLDSGVKGELALLPYGKIHDSPRLAWRGAMLDVARHFRSKEFVLKFLDWMAAHKLNVFHWHLTDDQAWRLEIKQYPKLTEVGAWRVPAGDAANADIDPETGKPRLHGGFYTQEDVREILAYAKARFITVMPEIGLPGHATAALAAYPEFGTVKSYTGDLSDWGIFENTYNLEPETFTFLEGVFDEVLALFPSEFIHIGGDEVATNQWAASEQIQARMSELGIHDVHGIQPYFTRHFANYLSERGRRLIGWDEILEGGSIDNSAIMSWRGTEGGVAAAKLGRQVVMSPSSIYYTDYRQSDSRHEPTGREHIQTLKDVYEFEPVIEELSAEQKAAIIGAQMTVFSEHMRTEERLEHMAFPRLLALAETVWSPAAAKDFDNFTDRLMPHMARLKSMGLRPADSAFEVRFKVEVGAGDTRTISLSNQLGKGDIRYTLYGEEPSGEALLYRGPFEVTSAQSVKAATFHSTTPLSETREQKLDMQSLSVRYSDELALCAKGLAIKLDDDAPVDGARAALMIDIMKPCWVYENPALEGVTDIEVDIANLPYNFQIGDLINDVQLLPPQTEDGELVVFEGSCTSGREIVRFPLAAAARNHGVTTLRAPLGVDAYTSNLCFQVAADHYEPLWAIDRVQLISN